MFGLGLKNKIKIMSVELSCFFKNKLNKPDFYDLKTPGRLGAIHYHPSDMCNMDCIMLYALIRGLKPKFAIEIGVRWGGSARIICNAMQDNGLGKIVGIDPATENFRVKSIELHDRYILHKGYSPDAIPGAMELLNTNRVDFVFIDALHVHDAVKKDFLGVLPYLTSGAHILFHDTYHQGVDKAITSVIREDESLHDLGFLTRNPESIGQYVAYQGLRLVRKGDVDSEYLITEAYKNSEFSVPPFHDSFRNYDEFANRVGLGATKEELEEIKELTKSKTY